MEVSSDLSKLIHAIEVKLWELGYNTKTNHMSYIDVLWSTGDDEQLIDAIIFHSTYVEMYTSMDCLEYCNPTFPQDIFDKLLVMFNPSDDD